MAKAANFGKALNHARYGSVSRVFFALFATYSRPPLLSQVTNYISLISHVACNMPNLKPLVHLLRDQEQSKKAWSKRQNQQLCRSPPKQAKYSAATSNEKWGFYPE